MTDQKYFTQEQAVEIIKKLAESGEIKLMQCFDKETQDQDPNPKAMSPDFNNAAYFNAIYLKAFLTELTQPCDEETFFDRLLDTDYCQKHFQKK